MKRLSFLILCFGFLICKQEFVSSVPQTQNSAPAEQIGSSLPSFSVDDLQGNKIDSSELKNRVALINFWATWCEPCRKEMPGYQSLLDRYGSKGLTVIGFKADVMTDTEDPMQFTRQLGIHYPIATGTNEIRKKFGGLEGLPTTYIYDRHGILRNKIIGFEYTGTIEKIIQKLL